VRELLAGLLVLAGCRAAELRSVASIDPLRDWFNANESSARFIALLSPT
jgi:hypothetical protein